MSFLPLVYCLVILLCLATVGMMYAQDAKEATNRAFRVFIINYCLWAASDVLQALPFFAEWSEEIFRVAGIFWITSTFWYLRFVYHMTGKKAGGLVFALGAVVVAVSLCYMFTDLGIVGVVPKPWGAIDVRGPFHSVFTVVPGVIGAMCIFHVYSAVRRSEDPRFKKSLKVVLVGGGFAMAVSYVTNVVLPLIDGYEEIPRLASCTGGIFVFFIYLAMYRYEFLTISPARVAEGLFEDVSHGVVLLDRSGAVRQMNPAALEILGLEDSRDASGLAGDILRAHGPLEQAENREVEIMLGEAGKERTLLLSHSTITRREVDLGRLVVIDDLTEQKRAEEVLRRSNEELEEAVLERTRELRQAQKMEALGTLAGGIAHDFNNLLAAIQGFATAARDELGADDEMLEDTEEILLAARQAKDIVRQMLDFSRTPEGTVEPVDVCRVAKGVRGLMRVSLPQNTTIVINAVCEGLLAQVDPSSLHQVFMNLCTNAQHAMGKKGGIIRIDVGGLEATSPIETVGRTLPPGQYVSVAVSDQGEGISPEGIEKVFEPFYTTKNPGEGTGLGLAMVVRNLHENGGGITLDSEVGAGSVFTAFLVGAKGLSEAPRKVSQVGPVGGTERILLVDDKEQIVRMGRRLLEPMGYRVTTFTRAEEALEAFLSRPDDYDLMISDYMMPEMTGMELASKVLARRPDFPVIMVSGNAGSDILARGELLGIFEFLDKPLSKATLVGAIRAALDRS